MVIQNVGGSLSKLMRNSVLIVRRTLVTSQHLRRNPPDLTSERYSHIKRADYASLSSQDVEYFGSVLPEDGQVLTDATELEGYNTDWLGIVRGASQIVLRPKTTQEVSEILKYCNNRSLAVVPQGGNTGLVGGSVPVFDEVIMSMQLMNNILQLDKTAGILTCQAGCILETLDMHLADYGLMMPLDLGAKGSCQIGGNISTNAGGIRLLRYGSLHGTVLGVEAVLADGEILDCMSTLRKDNTGYDLKQLFIGSEGTLGVVTGISILCPSRPVAMNVAFLSCDSFANVLKGLEKAKAMLGEVLSAYEFLDEASLACVEENLHMTNPLSSSPFYILIETSGSQSEHDEEKLNRFLEAVMESGVVTDGTIVTEPSKMKHIWSLRERVAEALLHDGYCYKYDVSLPLEQYYTAVEVMREKLAGLATRVVGYGHVGDGNLHFNVTSKAYSEELKKAIEPYFYEYVGKYQGSISAEHGLGFLKNNYISYSRSPAAIGLMERLKCMMDPKHILNPYKTMRSNKS